MIGSIKKLGGIEKLDIFDFAKAKGVKEHLFDHTLCYVSEELSTGTVSYLITTNKEVVEDLFKLANGNLGGLQTLFDQYDTLQADLRDTDNCSMVFRINNTLTGLTVKAVAFPLEEDRRRRIIAVSEVFKKHAMLESALNHKGVLITIKTSNAYKVVHSSLKWETLYSWLETGSLSEVLKIVGHLQTGYDIGKVLIPNLDKPSQSFEYISLLDIIEVKIVEE